MAHDTLEEMREAFRRYVATLHALAEHSACAPLVDPSIPTEPKMRQFAPDEAHRALTKLSEPLAKSYAQIVLDLQDENRVSWTGTAHEIRETLTTMLRLLAPDAEVVQQPWYKQEQNTSGPTQRQRVRFILEQRGAGSKQKEVVQQVESMEDWIGNLVRASYSRASDAAHGSKDRREVQRLFNYFIAFAHDLLDIEYGAVK
jgi:hypothetical protein